MTRSLTTKQREELYDSCRGDNIFPTCNICGGPIGPGQKWHQSHNPLLPGAIGGKVDGIAHAKCNLDHAHEIDVPLIAKVKRMRQKHIGAYRSSSRPINGSKRSPFRKKMNGQVEWRT
jgi:hypothetical protein